MVCLKEKVTLNPTMVQERVIRTSPTRVGSTLGTLKTTHPLWHPLTPAKLESWQPKGYVVNPLQACETKAIFVSSL